MTSLRNHMLKKEFRSLPLYVFCIVFNRVNGMKAVDAARAVFGEDTPKELAERMAANANMIIKNRLDLKSLSIKSVADACPFLKTDDFEPLILDGMVEYHSVGKCVTVEHLLLIACEDMDAAFELSGKLNRSIAKKANSIMMARNSAFADDNFKLVQNSALKPLYSLIKPEEGVCA